VKRLQNNKLFESFYCETQYDILLNINNIIIQLYVFYIGDSLDKICTYKVNEQAVFFYGIIL